MNGINPLKIKRGDFTKVHEQSASSLISVIIGAFNIARRKPSRIATLKNVLKEAHSLCTKYEKDYAGQEEAYKKVLAEQAKAQEELNKVEETK